MFLLLLPRISLTMYNQGNILQVRHFTYTHYIAAIHEYTHSYTHTRLHLVGFYGNKDKYLIQMDLNKWDKTMHTYKTCFLLNSKATL